MKVYGPIDSDQEKYSLLDRQIETTAGSSIAGNMASASSPIRRWPTGC